MVIQLAFEFSSYVHNSLINFVKSTMSWQSLTCTDINRICIFSSEKRSTRHEKNCIISQNSCQISISLDAIEYFFTIQMTFSIWSDEEYNTWSDFLVSALIECVKKKDFVHTEKVFELFEKELIHESFLLYYRLSLTTLTQSTLAHQLWSVPQGLATAKPSANSKLSHRYFPHCKLDKKGQK